MKLPLKSKLLELPEVATSQRADPKEEIMMFYGPPGVGKTTFVNQMAERVLFLSTDRGTKHMKAMRVACNTWLDFLKALDALEKKSTKYEVICIDHVDDWALAAEMYVCKKMGIDSLGDAGFAKGWRAFQATLAQYVGRLKALGTGIVFIAHETIRTVKSRSIEVDRTMPEMGKQAWKCIVPLVSIVGYCGFTRVKTATGKFVEKRTLVTQPREDLYAKDRTNRARPAFEELDGAAFMKTFASKSK